MIIPYGKNIIGKWCPYCGGKYFLNPQQRLLENHYTTIDKLLLTRYHLTVKEIQSLHKARKVALHYCRENAR